MRVTITRPPAVQAYLDAARQEQDYQAALQYQWAVKEAAGAEVHALLEASMYRPIPAAVQPYIRHLQDMLGD